VAIAGIIQLRSFVGIDDARHQWMSHHIGASEACERDTAN
jgi:hypothetical protein